jgi:hypothetical protein
MGRVLASDATGAAAVVALNVPAAVDLQRASHAGASSPNLAHWSTSRLSVIVNWLCSATCRRGQGQLGAIVFALC